MSKPINPKSDNSNIAPIGIDFGTTNSVMSKYTHSLLMTGPENLNFPITGSNLYPSIAIVDEEKCEIRTGLAAYNRKFIEPENIVSSVKRRIVEDSNFSFKGATISNMQIAEAIISDFIKEIKSTDYNFSPNVVVITVPYYFGENENALIKEAVENAIDKEFNSEPSFFTIPEPVAASLSCLYDIKDTLLTSKVFFIYDIGGGTLDMTLVKITNNTTTFSYEVLANDGMSLFGGDDIDLFIYEYVTTHEQLDFSNLTALQQNINKARLMEECKAAKQHLSSCESYDFMCPNLLGIAQGYIELTISREKLESIIKGDNRLKRNMLSDMDECIMRLYAKARIEKDSIDYVVPVGGTSLIPLFRKHLKELHPNSEEFVSSNQSDSFIRVANGASIYGALKSDEIYKTHYRPFKHQNTIEMIQTRISHSLYIEKYNGRLDKIVDANTISPFVFEKTYYPSRFIDDGEQVDIGLVRLYQGKGESRRNGEFIGDIDFSSYNIYSHGRSLNNIPIKIKIEVTDSLVIATVLIQKSDINGKDIKFSQVIHK
jgi:molecular chaperone DnaK (HSP70)